MKKISKAVLMEFLDEQINRHLKMGEELNKMGIVHSADCENAQARAFDEVKEYIEAYGQEKVSVWNGSGLGLVFANSDGGLSISDDFADAIAKALEDRTAGNNLKAVTNSDGTITIPHRFNYYT